jgi:very-short-patch-repair endonuclease
VSSANLVTITASLASKVTFASHQNAVPILRDMELENTSDEMLEGLTVVMTADPPFVAAKTWVIDRLGPQDRSHILDRDVDLNAGLLLETNESITGKVHIRVSCGEALLGEHVAEVEVLARNEWGGAAAMPELLAAFVTPNDPAIDTVLKAAAQVLSGAGKSDAINGYESKSRTRVWELASAIWSAVAGLRLSYALPPASFETNGQKVRTPGAILEGGLATCLDTALLFAAAMEQAGLNPILILTKGHAFVGLWLQPQEFSQLMTDDVSAVRKRIALNELVVFETTLVTQKPAPSFSRAVEEGVRQIASDKEGDFILALDVRRARMQRLRPLALQVKAEGAAGCDEATIVAESLEEAPALPDFDECSEEAKPTTPAGRIDQWQRKLLDLTVRNRLLHTRPNATTLRLICPDPGLLEDRLADSAKIRIVPQPPLEGPEAAGRDAALHLSRTGESLLAQYAAEALQRNEVLSPLDAKTLDASLVELYRKARLDLQEGGANTLFLAMGFLNWKRSADEPKTYRAPLILLPVTLERKSALSGVRMSVHEDEPRFNLTLLELLRQDFELTIPELEGPLPVDASGVDVAGVWTCVRKAVRDIPGFEVIEELALGTFSFAKYLMWKDLVERTDQLKANAVVRHLIETPRDPFQNAAEFPKPETLDDVIDPSELFAPLPADSSQLTAVVASARGCDFVLDGPPGTGKSQTIANMIAHNLALGRKVLFVAEKMAALEVVYRRLEERGLGAFCLELHSSKANKLAVVGQLGRAWDTRDQITHEEWVDQATRLKRLRDELNVFVRLLHQRDENGLTLHQAIGRTVRDANPRTPEFSWPADRRHAGETLERMRDVARRLDLNYGAVAGLDVAAFGPIAANDWSNGWQSQLLNATTALARVTETVAAARLSLMLGLRLDASPAGRKELAALSDLATGLASAHGRDLSFAFQPDASAIIDAVERGMVHLQNYQAAERSLSTPYPAEACRRVPVDALQGRLKEAGGAFWPLSLFKRMGVAGELKRTAGVSGKPQPAGDLPLLATMRTELERLDELNSQASRCSAWAGLQTDEVRLQQTLEVGRALREASARLAHTPEELGAVRAALRGIVVEANDMLGEAMPLRQSMDAYRDAHSAFLDALERFCEAAKCEHPIDDADLLTRVTHLCREISSHQPALKAWCDWRRVRGEAIDLDLKLLVDGLEAATLQPGEASDQMEVGYAKWWAAARIDHEPLLRGFVPAEHADRITAFQKLDDHVAELSSKYIRAKLAGAIPGKDDVKRESGYGVLRHELTKRMRHKPVRQLASEMGPALTTLTPCLLMSPLSIAQYLPAEADLFDLVIFDEASQITTWDAIGAIARGKQVIIAGDPKQMPPTSFFSRGAANPSESDEDVEEDLESILEECLGAGIPRHRLTWHYRSKHESLIAFSNHRYYESELITFPASVTKESAVTLRPVAGAYAKGKTRTNQIEAEAMVKEAVTRLKDPAFGGAGKSLAIVTLNSEQQRLVEDLLDRERQKHPGLEYFFSDQRLEPVVVKNLETVQGDERDLILLGIGFGPEVAGAPTMSMNFGPLNKSGGWRRLNVAITRAREEMVIFASFPPEMVDLNRTSAEAVRDLRHFLEFADRGPRALMEAVQGSVGGYESPFEQAVARGLQEKGWTVVPQIGVSRFRIDLGVVHPDRPGDYLVGVECDGAAYHSAATARDRDKVRARILGGLGWRLVRVWSTDWWIDSAGALSRLDAKLREELELRRTADTAKAATPQPQPPSPAFMDELDDELAAPPGFAEHPAREPVFAGAPFVGQASSAGLYRLADLSAAPGINAAAFHEPSYTAALRGLIDQVVKAEAPMRLDAVVGRVARAHGFQKAGRLIRERLEVLVRRDYAVINDSDGVAFVWPEAGAAAAWRGYRLPASEADVRWIDDIPMAELAAMGLEVAGGDLAVEVARRFGVRRVSAGARARIEAACKGTANDSG